MRSKFNNIVILTGAGISEESGIQTFRGSNGMWGKNKIDDVATLQAFFENPNLVHDFYNKRRRNLLSDLVKPNLAHDALANAEKKFEGSFTIITQNIDNLHERAGTKNVIHLHGELLKMKCTKCMAINHCDFDLHVNSKCPRCGFDDSLRPDVVWFGEISDKLVQCYNLLKRCDLFVSIGTSGIVHPASSFVKKCSSLCVKIEVNIEETENSRDFDFHFFGKSSEVVPRLIKDILKID